MEKQNRNALAELRTSPRSMKSIAVPMACVPVAQAETTPKLGPLALCSMATTPDAVLEMRAGIRKGDTYTYITLH